MATFNHVNRDTVLEISEVLNILANEEFEALTSLPTRPKGGEVFLIQGQGKKCWQNDGYK